MIYVTHDQVEAMTLAGRIAVMRAGKIQQIDTPAMVYDKPATMYVAGFLGSPSMNFLRACSKWTARGSSLSPASCLKTSAPTPSSNPLSRANGWC